MRMTQREILQTALRQSAVDCSCTEDDFLRDGPVVVESKEAEGASRYLDTPQICALFSYGANIVAACRKDLVSEVTRYVNETKTIYNCFDPPRLDELNRILLKKAEARVTWMHTFYLPEPELVFGAKLSCPYETREMHPEDFRDLYKPEWGNALCKDRKELDMLGVGALDGDRLIGLAACSADCADMWQIGIDVLPAYRRKGVASALTNQLARRIFDQGKVPFYAAAWANLRSVRNGLRSGFRPAWTVLTAKKGDSPGEKEENRP